MIKAVIWDWGGVCVNRITGIVSAKLQEKYDVDKAVIKKAYYENLDFYETGKMTGKEFWEKFGEIIGINLTADDVMRIIKAAETPREEVIDFIKKMKPKYKLALLSDNNELMIKYIREKFEIENWFDVQVISFEEGVMKPHREIYEICLERLGLEAKECVFIDDNAENVAGAEAVGMKAIQYLEFEQVKKDLVELGVSL